MLVCHLSPEKRQDKLVHIAGKKKDCEHRHQRRRCPEKKNRALKEKYSTLLDVDVVINANKVADDGDCSAW